MRLSAHHLQAARCPTAGGRSCGGAQVRLDSARGAS